MSGQQQVAEARVPLNLEELAQAEGTDGHKWKTMGRHRVSVRPIYPCHLCDEPCPTYFGGGATMYCGATSCDRLDWDRHKLMTRQSCECDREPDIGDVVTVEFADGGIEEATVIKELVGYLAGYYRAQLADGSTILYTAHPIK